MPRPIERRRSVASVRSVQIRAFATIEMPPTFGILENFNRVGLAATGEFFSVFASCDDLWLEPKFVETLVGLARSDLADFLGLVHCGYDWVGTSSGQPTRKGKTQWLVG